VVSYLVYTSGAVKPFVLVPRAYQRLFRLCSAVPILCVPRSKDSALASVSTRCTFVSIFYDVHRSSLVVLPTWIWIWII
jgi:hypothetical protein